MILQRNIFTQLAKELDTKEIIIITGMRRVGKTTALQYIYELIRSNNKAIFDLENPLHRKVFEEENYDVIWNNFAQFGLTKDTKAYIFIDEAQNLPEVSRVAKYLYDHFDVKFFLTGSSSYYLRNLFPESLAGRKLIFEMFPLTFGEFLHFKGIVRKINKTFKDKAHLKNEIGYKKMIPLYKEYIEFGGFPYVVLEQNRERKKVLLSELFTSYFEKDAKNLSDFNDMSKLRDLILLLAPRTASRIEINKLANSLSVSRETVYNYLAFLEQTYFITLLPKFSSSIDRQSAGSKKLYFCDSGIAGLLGQISQGQLFEQSVFQNLRGSHVLCYYSKAGDNEIDFIVDSDYALEAKITASKRDYANLKKRTKAIHIKNQYVVCLEYSNDNNVLMAVDL